MQEATFRKKIEKLLKWAREKYPDTKIVCKQRFPNAVDITFVKKGKILHFRERYYFTGLEAEKLGLKWGGRSNWWERIEC